MFKNGEKGYFRQEDSPCSITLQGSERLLSDQPGAINNGQGTRDGILKHKEQPLTRGQRAPTGQLLRSWALSTDLRAPP